MGFFELGGGMLNFKVLEVFFRLFSLFRSDKSDGFCWCNNLKVL